MSSISAASAASAPLPPNTDDGGSPQQMQAARGHHHHHHAGKSGDASRTNQTQTPHTNAGSGTSSNPSATGIIVDVTA